MTIKYISLFQEKIATKELETLAPYFESLTESNTKQFKTFLRSPYFNKDERLYDLYESLLKAHRNEATHLNGKTLLTKWAKSKPSSSNDTLLVIKKIKQLQSLLLDFYAHQELAESKTNKLDLLYLRFKNQDSTVILDKIKTDRQKLLQQQPTGLQQLIDSYLLKHHYCYEFSADYEQNGMKLMLELQQHLNDFHQTMQLIYSVEIENLKRAVTRQETSDQPLPTAPAYTKVQELFQLNTAIYDADGRFSKQGFNAFTQFFLEKHQKIDLLLRFILCKYTVNALLAMVNQGHSEYNEQLLEWLKRRVEWAPATLPNIEGNEFLNLIIISGHIGDVDFARWYAKEYAHKLVSEEANFAVALGEAFCCFYERRYTETRAILRKYFQPFSVKHYKYTLRSKTLLIRACLMDELHGRDGYEAFLRTKDNFRIYLNRLNGKIPAYYFDAYKNFLTLCNKIFLAQKIQPNQRAIQRTERFVQLRAQAMEMQHLTCKKWLIDELEKVIG